MDFFNWKLLNIKKLISKSNCFSVITWQCRN